MKAPPDAALADKAASKARKAQRRGTASGNTGGGAQDFRRYQSPSGLAVLVGRNSRQNDELSCRMAQPGDVWMHARSAGAVGGGGWPGRLRWWEWTSISSQTCSMLTAAPRLPRPVQGRAGRAPADARAGGAAASGCRHCFCR